MTNSKASKLLSVVVAIVFTVTLALTGLTLPAKADGSPSINILTNPGFEDGLTGWTTSEGTAVYTIDSTLLYVPRVTCLK